MNPDITLTSDQLKVFGVVKKTRTRLFKDIEVGDTMQIKNTIQYVGGASAGNYATYYDVTITNKYGKCQTGSFSQNELVRMMKTLQVLSIEDSWEEPMYDTYFTVAALIHTKLPTPSMSVLMKKFNVGYRRAGKILHQLDRDGFISLKDNVVLVTKSSEVQEKTDNPSLGEQTLYSEHWDNNCGY